MPIYEYQCSGCGHEFEFLVLPSSEKPSCPECSGVDLQQLLSTFAVNSKSTREANLASARKQGAKVQKEKQIEEHRRVHKELADHG